MADLITGQGQQAPKPMAADYLGRQAPISFEGKAALPVGGPGLGVSSGAPTISGSGMVPTAQAEPGFDPETAALMAEAERYLTTQGAGGGPAGSGPAPSGTSVSGMDANAISLGLGMLANAMGVPGLAAVAQGLVGQMPSTSAVPGAAIPDAIAEAIAMLSAKGLLPENEVTMNTPQGPVQGVAVNTPTSLLGLINAFIDTVMGNITAPGIAVPDVPNPTGIPSEHSPDFTVSPPGISPSAGWTDPTNITNQHPDPNSPTGFTADAPTAPPGGITGPDVSGPNTSDGGVAAGGGSAAAGGPSGTGDAGVGGPGSDGQA